MIDLDELARSIGAAVVPSEGTCSASTGVAVADVEHDSRLVERGSLFACIRGSSADGHDYAFDAVRRGAVALLVEETMPSPVPNLVVPSVRAALGPAAAAVHRHPSRRLDLVGVTGTNGKTTTVRLLAAILTSAGRTTDEMGTLTGARTTPEATDVQRRLAGAVDRGRRAVAMEVSSHALDQGSGRRLPVPGGRFHEPGPRSSRLPRHDGSLLRGQGSSLHAGDERPRRRLDGFARGSSLGRNPRPYP